MAQAYTVFQGSDGEGGDYSTLKGAVDAVTETNSTITITDAGWTVADTSASMTIDGGDGLVIEAVGASSTNGVAESHANGKTNAYRLRDTNTANSSLIYIQDTCELKGFEIAETGTGTSDELLRMGTDDHTVTLTNMLMYFDSRNDQQDGLYTNEKRTTVVAENCVVYNCYRSFIDNYQNDNHTATVNSCTFKDCGFQLSSGGRTGIFGNHGTGTHVCKIFNSLIDLNSASYVNDASTTSSTSSILSDYCIFENSSGNWSGDNVDTETDVGTSYSITFSEGDPASCAVGQIDLTTSPTYDLTLYDDETDNLAQDFCQVTTGATSGLVLPTTDIAGNTRNAGTSGYYDCGAFNVTAAAAGARPQGPLGHPFRGAFAGPIG